jgi:hypothetical protein
MVTALTFAFAFMVLAGWFAWVLRRFQLYWDAGDSRISKLGAALREAERELAIEQREQEKKLAESKHLDRQADKHREDERLLRQKQMETPPAPPIEILVTSEFPSSASEDPWIANLARRFAAKPGDRPPRRMLFWAAGYQAAMSRSQHMAGEFVVNDIRKLAVAAD